MRKGEGAMRAGAAAVLAVLGMVVVTVAAPSCGDYGPVTLMDQDGGDADGIRGRNVGEACDERARCRSGLVCQDGRCVPSRALEEGAPCVISAECKEGLFCSASRVCARSGRGAAGDTCGSEADCSSGLRCNAVGLSAECQPEGASDVGAACGISPECFGGLLCTEKKCAAPPASTGAPPVAVSAFTGVACADEPGPVRAHFRVPRGADDGDFFRLPFPNDARRKNGRLDLSGFPTPGADVLGYDLVDRWARYVEESANGFSAYPTIIFRFSATPDFATLKQDGVIRFVDVTPSGSGTDVGFGWNATNVRSKYVCGNTITARPAPGLPLEAGHTYAMFITNGAKAPGGVAIEASPDLRAVLGPADPGAPLSAAWSAYAPLRAWASANALDPATLVNATVFTVGKHPDLVGTIADAIEAAPPPAASGWIKCGAAPSPCPQAQAERACGPADAAFDELHALVTLPTWQQGTAPFASPAEGGDVVFDGSGAPAPQGSQQVCVSLSIPKGAPMPAGGWPLAIYAHATGGSFRSSVADGIAKRFASIEAGAARVAVLGFDGVAHGPRRGASNARPQALWFLTSNPRAMRGNGLQAASDVLALTRFAEAFTLADTASPTGAEIRFGDVALVGHGQGATAVALAGPRASVKGVVVGGVGASFVDTVPAKRNPVAFFSVAPVVLGEVTLGNAHPALAMFQNALDPIDPLDHASLLVTAPVTTAKHAFVVYGRDDSFTPGPTQVAYTFAAGLGVANPPPSVTMSDNLGSPPMVVPAGGNTAGGLTAIVRQYQPSGYDGHFVLLRSVDAMRDVDLFVGDALRDQTPMVGR
ncbi:MAG: hypothetical protein KF819_10230 [Labilithrix sp.]|nr:hypothetical protein [Labilithrix sp.]